MAPLTDQQQTFIDDLLAIKKAIYGLTRMEESTETPPEGEPEPVVEPPAEPVVEKSPEDELPDWARKELTKVRGEAANYRTRLRDADARLATAKTPEEFEAAVAEVKAANTKLERSVLVTNVAREFNLPTELSELLKGEDEAALKVHAKTLAKFAPPAKKAAPEKLAGGLSPDDVEDGVGMNPGELARKYGGRRR